MYILEIKTALEQSLAEYLLHVVAPYLAILRSICQIRPEPT
jgi:hypothetical protein